MSDKTTNSRQAPDHNDPIDQIDYAAWCAVKHDWTWHANRRIYDQHRREEVIQEAVIIFCRKHRRLRTGLANNKTDISDPKHVAQMARWSIDDAARDLHCEQRLTAAGRADKKADQALGIVKADPNYERANYYDDDPFLEKISDCFYKTSAELAISDRADAVLEFSDSLTDKRFSQICSLLMEGFNQKQIAKLLGMAASTVNGIITKNRDLLLAQVQIAKGGC